MSFNINENYNYFVKKFDKECNETIEYIKSDTSLSDDKKQFWIEKAEYVKERQIERLNRLFKINE